MNIKYSWKIEFSDSEIERIGRGEVKYVVVPLDPQPDVCSPDWRFNGDSWEMYYGYPAGHDVPPCPFVDTWGSWELNANANLTAKRVSILTAEDVEAFDGVLCTVLDEPETLVWVCRVGGEEPR